MTRSTEKKVLQVIDTAECVANFLFKTGRALKAIELCKERLILLNNMMRQMSSDFVPVSDQRSAIESDRMHCQCDKNTLMTNAEKQYANLGTVFQSRGEYVNGEEYLRKALQINREIGDKHGEAACYTDLGTVFHCLGEFGKAKEYLRKALQVNREIGDKCGEATCYTNLGTVFLSIGAQNKAEEYFQKALHIKREIGDKRARRSNMSRKFRNCVSFTRRICQ